MPAISKRNMLNINITLGLHLFYKFQYIKSDTVNQETHNGKS